MSSFQNYIAWKETKQNRSPNADKALRAKATRKLLSLPKFPTQARKRIAHIQEEHCAPEFSAHLKEFLNALLPHPASNRNAVLHHLPFDRLDVYHILKFHPASLDDREEECDVVKAISSRTRHGGRFDAVVVLHGENAEATGLEGA